VETLLSVAVTHGQCNARPSTRILFVKIASDEAYFYWLHHTHKLYSLPSNAHIFVDVLWKTLFTAVQQLPISSPNRPQNLRTVPTTSSNDQSSPADLYAARNSFGGELSPAHEPPGHLQSIPLLSKITQSFFTITVIQNVSASV